ncbi:MAG: glucose-1-phosphate thymidylyltransferase RfbA [Hyphomonadaceae bacterium]|nr:glucose-1-phosphate thymidylyltransferase RfbA [Hyphomonadaceae bacterium]
MKRKGIILAGGSGTRLHPSTISVSKQLMPVFDKPMIYYPLCTLLEAGMRDILIITTPQEQALFEKLLKDGSQWGINIEWAVQPSPDGLAQALIIAEKFLDGRSSALVLGDNIFFGNTFSHLAADKALEEGGATIFGYRVKNPQDYGVVGFDDNQNAVSLEEKPEKPASEYAVTGLYFYDKHAPEYAKQITPSARGELEITDLNRIYMDREELTVELLQDGASWLDTGTHRSLLKAANFVSIIESRQGVRICCPEATAYKKGWIDSDQLHKLAKPLEKSGYGKYLIKVLQR